ncbi:hypothetical protein [Shinella sp.]|jgi:hypothetical protein|uniref:hypothetical protein n=1 Tax=Shinella sp. TaxID=1870904 RepID=UPI003F6F5776
MEDVNQTTHQRCKQAVLAELIAAGCTPDNPIALYLVGPTLVAAGFTEQQIISALDFLEYERHIEYTGGNRVRLT